MSPVMWQGVVCAHTESWSSHMLLCMPYYKSPVTTDSGKCWKWHCQSTWLKNVLTCICTQFNTVLVKDENNCTKNCLLFNAWLSFHYLINSLDAKHTFIIFFKVTCQYWWCWMCLLFHCKKVLAAYEKQFNSC